METRGLFAIAFVILLAGFLSSALTGDVTTFQASTGMNFNPNAGRYALGNVDRDPEGVIDYMDLVALKNLISVRKYDATADMDQDKDVDFDDYNLLAHYLKAGYGSASNMPRSDVCNLGETKCGQNTQDGIGTLYVCRENEIGVPEMMREDCPSGMRCRNDICEPKQAILRTWHEVSIL